MNVVLNGYIWYINNIDKIFQICIYFCNKGNVQQTMILTQRMVVHVPYHSSQYENSSFCYLVEICVLC